MGTLLLHEEIYIIVCFINNFNPIEYLRSHFQIALWVFPQKVKPWHQPGLLLASLRREMGIAKRWSAWLKFTSLCPWPNQDCKAYSQNLKHLEILSRHKNKESKIRDGIQKENLPRDYVGRVWNENPSSFMLCYSDIKSFQSPKFSHKRIENAVVQDKPSELIFTLGFAILRNLANY